MFIQTAPRMPSQDTKSASERSDREALTDGGVEQRLVFKVKRLMIAAGLLVAILLFAIGTAFFAELAQLHTMLVHAFELVLGLVAGLLGGEAIAKAENG